MKRVIDFEFKKNIYDVKRLILFGVSFLTLLLLFVFMITKVFEIIPHDPQIRNLEYSQSYIDFLTTKREYYYEEYLTFLPKKSPTFCDMRPRCWTYF